MEEIVGCLENVSLHTYDTVYDLVFTGDRVIAFNVKHPTDIPYRYPNIIEAMLLPGIFMNKEDRAERGKLLIERRQCLKTKSTGELLGVHPANFEILYENISSIEVKQGFAQSQIKFAVGKQADKNHVICFSITRNQIPDARRLIEKLLSEKFTG
jgi:hypothetical protein